MSRQEAAEQYAKALRQGRRFVKDCVHHGRYPYPQVLDEILDVSAVAGQLELGVVEIPAELIVGTKTSGRRNAFSASFMPLIEMNTEFSEKWISLCSAHLEEGIRDPIRCYEYLGRFYVQEGNKRVSVLKSYDAPTVFASVVRVIPMWSDEPDILAYYEFMHAYPLTGLYQVRFSQAGSFAKLQAALGYEADHVWTEDERRRFTGRFSSFRRAFEKRGGASLPITAADALLVWLKIYSVEQLRDMSAAELNRSLEAVWPDIEISCKPEPISVSTQPPSAEEEPPQERGLLDLLFKHRETLNVAFISEQLPEESDWARAHDIGRQYLEAVMGDRITVQSYAGVGAGAAAEEAIDRAVDGGAEVVFATTPPLISACRKAAAKYPGLRILNCSIAMPYTGVRTYYGRIYEGKFITGAIAGTMAGDGRIGYVASSPIFGVPASINAFALGARLTNPRAQIRVRWSCAEEDPVGALAADGVTVISNRDVPTPDRILENWGLCQVRPEGGYRFLASPYWHWGNIYVRLVRSILSGGWDALSAQNSGKAVNYWWGMDSRSIGLLVTEDLPTGLRQLVNILRDGLENGSLHPFHRPIHSQDGALRSDGSRWFTPEEILHMDWLTNYVEGRLPAFDELLPFARNIVRLQGIYRDELPPEKEGTIL